MSGLTRCDCCGRLLVTYKRTITAPMAAALIAIHRRGQGGWVHLPTFKMSFSNVKLRAALSGGDVSKLRFWGLLMADPMRVAYWMITRKGDRFALDQIRLRKIADVRLNVRLGLHGPLVGIKDALREQFDYNKLITL